MVCQKFIRQVQQQGWVQYFVVITSKGFSHRHGFVSWLCYLLTVWAWATYLSFQKFKFLIFKMDAIKVTTSYGW